MVSPSKLAFGTIRPILDSLSRVNRFGSASRLTVSVGLVLGSLATHLWLVLASRLFDYSRPFGDLSLYNYWAFQINQGGPVLGFQTDWVYPGLALVLIWLPSQITIISYEAAWLLLVFLLNTIVLLSVANYQSENRSGPGASWFFLLGLALLGPVAISRIDSPSAALALFGIALLVSNRKGLAAAMFTIAGWIKVWPVALFLALLVSVKQKMRPLLVASGLTATILAIGFSQSPSAILSFVFSQQQRGLQIESVAATWWMWLTHFGLSDIYFDEQILTNQIRGPFVLEVAALLDLFMVLALVTIAALAFRSRGQGKDELEVFVWTAVAAVTALIVFNKVGSPQFIIWLLVPMVAGVYMRIQGFSKLVFTILMIAFLTQLIYPVFYLDLLALEVFPLVILTMRNLLLVAVMIYALLGLTRKQSLK